MCSAEVDEFGRGKTQQLHTERMQRLPYRLPCFLQLGAEFSFRLLQEKFLQR